MLYGNSNYKGMCYVHCTIAYGIFFDFFQVHLLHLAFFFEEVATSRIGIFSKKEKEKQYMSLKEAENVPKNTELLVPQKIF